MSTPRFGALGLMAVLALVSQSARADLLTAVSSRAELGAFAQASNSVSEATDTDFQAQGATINNLFASVSAESIDGVQTVNTLGTLAATWSSASEGSVAFSELGWIANNIRDGGARVNDANPDFFYEFVANVDTVLLVDYAISGFGSDLFGLNGFVVELENSTTPGEFLGVNTSGQISFAILAGQTYKLTISNNANISGGLGTRDALMNGAFRFRAVPEPSSLALMGLGVLGTAALARRRRV